MRIFILEDEVGFYPRSQLLEVLAGHELTIAKSCEEGKKLYKGGYDLLLLDHDMVGHFTDARHPNTGLQFLKWMLPTHKGPVPQVILHSQNPTGRTNMRKLLLDYKWTNVDECPFGTEYVNQLRKL